MEEGKLRSGLGYCLLSCIGIQLYEHVLKKGGKEAERKYRLNPQTV
jgi:hypothetical protein